MSLLLFHPEQFPQLTYADLFLEPYNPVEEDVVRAVQGDDAQKLQALSITANKAREIALRDRNEETSREALTRLQAYQAEVRRLARQLGVGKSFSRDEVDLTPPRGNLSNTPVVVANMNTVTGKRMAEAIAAVGGIAAIPQDKSNEEIRDIISYLRSRHSIYQTPISITLDTKIHEFRRYMQKRDMDSAVVLDAQGKLIGILSPSDVPAGLNDDQAVRAFVRTNDIVTAQDGITPLEAFDLMDRTRIHFLPIERDGMVIGVLTRKHASMLLRYQPNIDKRNGGFNVLMTVGALNRDPVARVQFLFELGMRNILLDTANFDQGVDTYANLEAVRAISPELNILVGNIVTREAARRCIGAGANGVKIGVGPGYVCKTRRVSGAGRPQGAAVFDVADEAHLYGAYAVADGGIDVSTPGDAAKAIGLNADYVMFGSSFAPTRESPPDLHEDERGFYKEHRGMAEARSSMFRTHGRTDRTPSQKFRDGVGHRSEGVAIRSYQQDGLSSAADVHHAICDGMSAGAGYCYAKTMKDLQNNARFGIQMPSGNEEGKPKGER